MTTLCHLLSELQRYLEGPTSLEELEECEGIAICSCLHAQLTNCLARLLWAFVITLSALLPYLPLPRR